MGDLISRQAALDIFDDYNVAVENGQIEAYSRDRKRLCNLPPVTPKQRTGKWIPKDGRYYCDRCSGIAPKGIRWDFCPNCGAKMEGAADND